MKDIRKVVVKKKEKILIGLALIAALVIGAGAILTTESRLRIVAIPDCADGLVFFTMYTGGVGQTGGSEVRQAESTYYTGLTFSNDPAILKTYCGVSVTTPAAVPHCEDHTICYSGGGCIAENWFLMKKYCNLEWRDGAWSEIKTWWTPTPTMKPTKAEVE